MVGLLLFAAAAPVVVGAGNNSCGQWLEARRADGMEAVIMGSWLGGYISAANTAGAGDVLAGGRLEDARLWIDNYCRARPMNTLKNATDEFLLDRIKP